MKHALNRDGSRDSSGDSRHGLWSVSKAVPWQPSVGKPKPTYKRRRYEKQGEGKKAKQEPEVDGDSIVFRWHRTAVGTGKPVPMSEKAKGKQRAEASDQATQAERQGSTRLGSDMPASSSRQSSPDPVTTPPVFWTEVFSRPDSRWMPVDPVRGLVNKRKAFDPTPTPAGTVPGTSSPAPNPLLPPRAQPKPANYYSQLPKGTKQENRMLYVMAFEEDGFARDVTRRYARDYNSKIAKHQGGQQRFQIREMQEGMPTTIAGFKDHPLYVLTRHLKQSEVIHPPPPETPEIVRRDLDAHEGRIIKAGCQPLKTVKARAATCGECGGYAGLYSRSQTEVYVPPPVVDGKIPKNDFGNIDMYASDDVAEGSCTSAIPGFDAEQIKGLPKIAKKLGFDYAEAVTGFEFRKRRANAVIEGIVIATENESAVLDAYWEHQKAEDEKAQAKKEEKALQHWIKLVQGLRIRQRLQEEYADRGTPSKAESSKKGASAKKTKRKTAVVGDEPGEASPAGETSGGFLANDDDDELEDRHGEGHGGGFLVEADDVVQAFNLPKYNPLILESTSNPFASSSRLGKQKHHHHGTEVKPDDNHPRENPQTIDYATYDLEDLEEPALSEGTMDVDVDMESEGVLVEGGVSGIEGRLRWTEDHGGVGSGCTVERGIEVAVGGSVGSSSATRR
ncbi:Rad4-domain-containing protein [Coprinellus micaceus]|uniref:Rad4-domain-containing protein n=1 Tax=Coprinellus micaceus TaxID=71717 RepID=A0A4Y7R5E1_COPMI|nr:Rad4-domain-containing protein [Coprinellus micaceus]